MSYRTAIHESGHYLAAVHMGFEPLFITNLPDIVHGTDGAVAVTKMPINSQQNIERKIFVLLAGPMAERRFFAGTTITDRDRLSIDSLTDEAWFWWRCRNLEATISLRCQKWLDSAIGDVLKLATHVSRHHVLMAGDVQELFHERRQPSRAGKEQVPARESGLLMNLQPVASYG